MKEIFGNLFKDKKILITGHTGFMGAWLSIWLNELGADIVGYALKPKTNKDIFVLSNLDQKITSLIEDIRDFNKLKKVFEIHNPEIVFHLAAQPIVRESYLFPKETYDINVGGTVNIIENFRKSDNCKVLINVTSDKCYENLESLEGYCEEDRLGGYDPYSSSKACSELVTNAYRNSFFLSDKNMNNSHKIISSVRSGNVIGGGDWQKDRIIPDCINAIQNNEEIIIRSPNSIRPWQYVLEPIRGYLMLAMRMWEGDYKYSGAWNFGPNKDKKIKVIELVKRIIEYLGKGRYKLTSNEGNNYLHETKTLILDCSKSENFLGWKSILNIDDVIKFTCDWYIEDNIDYNFCKEQINKYILKIKD